MKIAVTLNTATKAILPSGTARTFVKFGYDSSDMSYFH
jgi:hypothetical protein